MRRTHFRSLVTVLVMLAVLALGGLAQAGAISDGPWQTSGGGALTVTPDAGNNCVSLGYNESTPNWAGSLRSWSFSTTATTTQAIPVTWEYSGLHSWFMAYAEAQAYVDGPGGRQWVTLKPYGQVWDSFSFSGTTTLNVNQGHGFGFVIKGKNWDSSWLLFGTLKVCGPAAPADTNPPAITAQVTGTQGTGGWYTSDVTVSFTCTDDVAVASCSAPVTLGEGAGQSVTGTATDTSGNTANATAGPINVDKTAPTVTYSGNAGAYTVDQTVNIICAASDNLSGVASSTCANVTGPAYGFALGAHSASATAVDNAGLTGTGSTSFTVSVSYDSLCGLTTQFVSNSQVASDMCDKLMAAKASDAKGNAKSKAGQIGAYINHVQAQTGKTVTAQNAAILIHLANSL